MLPLLIAATLLFSNEDAEASWRFAEELVEKYTPRDSGTIRTAQAADFILRAAKANGASVRVQSFKAPTPSGIKVFKNVCAEFNYHPEDEWTVLVSHYDTKIGTNCPGANDGASTTALLVVLANKLSVINPERGNVMIIWTDGEECVNYYADNDGLHGSTYAAKKLAESGRKIGRVICLDMLGDKFLQVSIPANSSKALARLVIAASKAIDEPGLVKLSTEIVKDDHVPFMNMGMEVIDLIDFEYGKNNCYWHTSEDTMDKLSKLSLLKSGRLICETLNQLLKR